MAPKVGDISDTVRRVPRHDPTTKVTVRLTAEQSDALDSVRGTEPASSFLRGLLLERLREADPGVEPSAAVRAGLASAGPERIVTPSPGGRDFACPTHGCARTFASGAAVCPVHGRKAVAL
jgi:hypothetical protein